LEPLAEDAAVELFLARVRAVRPGAAEPTVARAVVRAVDGLPLAIELAAARCAVADPADLVRSLAPDTLALPGAVGRHGSIRALLGGSWDALAPPDRALLAAASAFARAFVRD